MKQKIVKTLLLFGALALISSFNPGCKSKKSDTDVKTSVESSLKKNPDLTVVMVDVKDGVVTLTGEVKDETARASAASNASAVDGVKSVNNNITVATMAAPTVEITGDATLTTSVSDAIKDHSGVRADVKDGVITLTGEIRQSDLATLMQKLSALKPKKIENKLTIK